MRKFLVKTALATLLSVVSIIAVYFFNVHTFVFSHRNRRKSILYH